MAISGKQCFCLLLVFTASIHTTTALHKRSDDVSTQAVMALVQQQTVTIQRLEAKLTSVEATTQQQSSTITDLNTKLTSAETRLTVVEATTHQQSSTITDLNTKLTSAKTKVTSAETRLISVEATTHQQSSTITDLNTKLMDVTSKLEDVNSSLSVGLNNINARLETTVFFTAHTSKSPVTAGDNSPIRFDAVTSNVGGGYNPITGVFTAPVSGVYVVYAQLMKHNDVSTIWWVLDKSGDYLCMNRLDQTSNDGTSSCLATTGLTKGEQVFVRRSDGDQTLEGHWYCSFSGFLLSSDP